MKHCAMHLDHITVALKKRNLWQMVTGDRDAVIAQGLLWLTGNVKERKHVNPLVIVVYEIYQRAATTLPYYVQNPAVDYCPLCELAKLKTAQRAQEWIDGYSDELKRVLVDIEFVKP